MICLEKNIHGNFSFLDIIWVIIGVKEDGLLGVTQQLSELGHPGTCNLSPIKQLDHRTENTACALNPFASPVAPAVPFNSPARPATGEQPHRTSRRELFQMTEVKIHYCISVLLHKICQKFGQNLEILLLGTSVLQTVVCTTVSLY